MKNSFSKLLAFLSLFLLGATPAIDLAETRFKQQLSTSEPMWVVLVHPWQEDSLKLERLAKLAYIWDNIVWVDVTKPWAKKRWGVGNTLIKNPTVALKYEKGHVTQQRHGLNKIFVFLIANVEVTK
jgi:hypothetical protein